MPDSFWNVCKERVESGQVKKNGETILGLFKEEEKIKLDLQIQNYSSHLCFYLG